MTRIFILCGLIIAAGFAAIIWARSGPEVYGQPFKGFQATNITEVVSKPELFLDKDIRLEGSITRQCPASGCWFYITDDKGTMRAEFANTAPKLPQRKGRIAVVEGRLMKSGEGFTLIGSSVEFR